MALVAGFRPEGIDHDYKAYVEMYYRSFSITTEPTFLFIASFVELFFDDVQFLFVVYALLTMIVCVCAINKLSSLRFLSLLVYLSTFYLLHGMNQIRVGVAAGFVLLAYSFLLEKKRSKFFLYAFFATLFHYSAAVIFLLFFFDTKPLKKWHLYLLSSLLPIAYLAYFFKVNIFLAVPIPYVEEKIMLYQALQEGGGQWDEINVFNLVFLARIVIFYFLLWKNRLIYENNKYASLLLKIEGLALAAFVVLYSIPVLAIRLSELLAVVEIILIPMVAYTIKPAWVGRVAVVFVALTLLMINLFYNRYIEV